MKLPVTMDTPTPLQIHERQASQYKILPPEVESFKPLATICAIILIFIFIIIPISNSFGKMSLLIYYLTVPASLYAIFDIYNDLVKKQNDRNSEIKLRKDTKDKFIRMQLWYEKEEPLHRNRTKQGNKSTYPYDWVNRKEYIEARDGACYLCGKTSTNQQIYRSMPYKKRINGIKPKDLYKYHHVHHIIPISKGGNHALSNLVFLCGKCHEDQHDHMRRLK